MAKKCFVFFFLVCAVQQLMAGTDEPPRSRAALLAHHRFRPEDLEALSRLIGGNPDTPLETRLRALVDALGGAETNLTAQIDRIKTTLGGPPLTTVTEKIAALIGAVSGPPT